MTWAGNLVFKQLAHSCACLCGQTSREEEELSQSMPCWKDLIERSLLYACLHHHEHSSNHVVNNFKTMVVRSKSNMYPWSHWMFIQIVVHELQYILTDGTINCWFPVWLDWSWWHSTLQSIAMAAYEWNLDLWRLATKPLQEVVCHTVLSKRSQTDQNQQSKPGTSSIVSLSSFHNLHTTR